MSHAQPVRWPWTEEPCCCECSHVLHFPDSKSSEWALLFSHEFHAYVVQCQKINHVTVPGWVRKSVIHGAVLHCHYGYYDWNWKPRPRHTQAHLKSCKVKQVISLYHINHLLLLEICLCKWLYICYTLIISDVFIFLISLLLPMNPFSPISCFCALVHLIRVPSWIWVESCWLKWVECVCLWDMISPSPSNG